MKDISLRILDMECAACVARLDRALEKLPGVQRAAVNYTAASALITYDERVTDLAAACAGAGCAVTPGELRGGDADQELEKRMDLLKTLVASACCTAPLMLEMHPKLQFLAGTALQFGPGRYFYKSAWRGARNRTFGMDFLVSLSSTLIYLYSAYVTFTPRRSYKLYFASDGVLHPSICATAMSASSIGVLMHSLRLKDSGKKERRFSWKKKS